MANKDWKGKFYGAPLGHIEVVENEAAGGRLREWCIIGVKTPPGVGGPMEATFSALKALIFEGLFTWLPLTIVLVSVLPGLDDKASISKALFPWCLRRLGNDAALAGQHVEYLWRRIDVFASRLSSAERDRYTANLGAGYLDLLVEAALGGDETALPQLATYARAEARPSWWTSSVETCRQAARRQMHRYYTLRSETAAAEAEEAQRTSLDAAGKVQKFIRDVVEQLLVGGVEGLDSATVAAALTAAADKAGMPELAQQLQAAFPTEGGGDQGARNTNLLQQFDTNGVEWPQTGTPVDEALVPPLLASACVHFKVSAAELRRVS